MRPSAPALPPPPCFQPPTRLALALVATLAGAAACKDSGGGPGGGSGGSAGSAGAPGTGGAGGAGPGDGGSDGVPAPEAGAPVTRSSVLAAFGACAAGAARDFNVAAAELASATAAFEADPSAAKRDAAREAFRRAIDVWQISETLQFGPGAPKAVPGGADLRDNIYSWPLVSRCAVEEEIASGNFRTAGVAGLLINRRGLGAIEYLLFYEGQDSACAPGSAGATAYAALAADERGARKRAYAAKAAADVQSRASMLATAWDPAGGNFLATFAGAGPGNPVYPTPQKALNAASDALFYVELGVKDMKLARPLGLRECMMPSCPEELESRYAARSKANVAANLVGFRKLFEGCGPDLSGPGFDDVLATEGQGALATTIKEHTAATVAALAAIEEPDLEEALARDPASVRAVYDRLKLVTDVLKTQFTSVLNLEIPAAIEADND